MHLPVRILKFIGKLPDRELAAEVILGSLLKEEGKELKFKEMTQLKFNSWYFKLKSFPARKLAQFKTKFEDYLSEVFEEYSLDFPAVELGKEPSEFKDFKELYGTYIDIKEREIAKYFDSLFPSVEEGTHVLKPEVLKEENSAETLPYTLKKLDIFTEKLVVNSQSNSVKRMSKIPEITNSHIKSLYFVFNINSYILSQKEELTDITLDVVLDKDIAELNALGVSVEKANKVLIDFMFKNFDTMSDSFF